MIGYLDNKVHALRSKSENKKIIPTLFFIQARIELRLIFLCERLQFVTLREILQLSVYVQIIHEITTFCPYLSNLGGIFA